MEVLLPALLQTCKLMLTSFVAQHRARLRARRRAASLKPGGIADSVISLFAFAGISVPVFWLALVLILVVAVQLALRCPPAASAPSAMAASPTRSAT